MSVLDLSRIMVRVVHLAIRSKEGIRSNIKLFWHEATHELVIESLWDGVMRGEATDQCVVCRIIRIPRDRSAAWVECTECVGEPDRSQPRLPGGIFNCIVV